MSSLQLLPLPYDIMTFECEHEASWLKPDFVFPAAAMLLCWIHATEPAASSRFFVVVVVVHQQLTCSFFVVSAYMFELLASG